MNVFDFYVTVWVQILIILKILRHLPSFPQLSLSCIINLEMSWNPNQSLIQLPFESWNDFI